jgi:TolB-like protein
VVFRTLFLALFVVGIAPAPQPAATPTPTPPSLAQLPTILVYPFDVQTGADPKLGIAIAQIFGQEMAAAGGLSVLAVPQGVARANFLSNARGEQAEFYISGYVTQVGDSASVVEQVVSVDSGVILFSQTAQVNNVADVASLSLLARTEILTFVGRNTETLQTQTANTPAPTSTNGAAVPVSGITNIVDSVFKHKNGARGTPSPAVVKPPRGVIVATATAVGAVPPADLTNATHELYFAMNRYFTTQATGVTSDPAQSADAICGANRDNTIAAGTLQETTAAHRRPNVTFVLQVYTCFGAQLERETGKGATLKMAVDAAVAAYAKAHPDNS